MEYIFQISVEETQYHANKEIGRNLTDDELILVRKGVEFGLELSWDLVLKTAIHEAVERSVKLAP